MSITKETRRESWEKTKATLGPRHQEIIDLLREYPMGLTAWEVADKLKRPVYVVRPRLTESRTIGEIQVSGKKYNPITKRSEAIWIIQTMTLDSSEQGLFI